MVNVVRISSHNTVQKGRRGLSTSNVVGTINAENIQRLAINAIIQVLGSDIWQYGFRSGARCNRMGIVKTLVRRKCRCFLSDRTLRRWMTHYIQYGETPAMTKRRVKRKATNCKNRFTDADKQLLRNIIADHPQLYLDEIQEKMHERTGRRWSLYQPCGIN